MMSTLTGIDIIRSLSILFEIDKYDIELIRDTVIHILNNENVNVYQVYIDESYLEEVLYHLEYYKSKNELMYTINDCCIDIKWENMFIKLYFDYVSVQFSIENVKMYMIDENEISYDIENTRYTLNECMYDIETKHLYSKFKYDIPNNINEILYKPFLLRTEESINEFNRIICHLINYIRYLKKGFMGDYKCIPSSVIINEDDERVDIFTQEKLNHSELYVVKSECCGGCYDLEYLLEYIYEFDKPVGGGTINSWELKKCPLCRGRIKVLSF